MFVSTRLRTAGTVIAVSAVLFGAGCSSGVHGVAIAVASGDTYTAAETALDKVRAAYEITAGQQVQRGEVVAQGNIITTTIDSARDTMLGQLPNSPYGPTQVLFEGDDLFMRFTDVPRAHASLLDSDVWYRVDTASDEGALVLFFRDLARNRLQTSALVSESIIRAEEKGTDMVQAVDVTRFSATLDVASYVDAVLETFADSLPAGPDTPSPAEVRRNMIEETSPAIELWIDGKGRIVRQIFAGNDTTTSYDVDFVPPEFDRANAPLAPIS